MPICFHKDYLLPAWRSSIITVNKCERSVKLWRPLVAQLQWRARRHSRQCLWRGVTFFRNFLYGKSECMCSWMKNGRYYQCSPGKTNCPSEQKRGFRRVWWLSGIAKYIPPNPSLPLILSCHTIGNAIVPLALTVLSRDSLANIKNKLLTFLSLLVTAYSLTDHMVNTPFHSQRHLRNQSDSSLAKQ